MAIKFSCGSCGRKLAVKDEHAGRRAKCMSCGWEGVIPFQSTLDTDNSLEAQPAPKPPPIPAQIAPMQTDGGNGPKPYLAPAVESRHSRRSSWLVAVVAGLCAAFGLGGWFLGRARLAVPSGELHKAAESVAVSSGELRGAAEVPSTPLPPSPAPKPVTRFDPATIERIAQIYPARAARILFGKGDDVKEVKILESNVRRSAPNRRRIDWLWEADVTFTITYAKGDDVPVRMTMLYHLSPDGEEWECWRNVTVLIGGGITRRVSMKSPWKDWFEEQVRQEWLNATESSSVTTTDYAELKERMAYKFQVSVEEFGEILHPAK
jgi:hypothetical protein